MGHAVFGPRGPLSRGTYFPPVIAVSLPYNREKSMKKFILMTTGLVFAAGAALANDGLVSKMNDPAQWAIQTGDYKNQHHSKLTQIS